MDNNFKPDLTAWLVMQSQLVGFKTQSYPHLFEGIDILATEKSADYCAKRAFFYRFIHALPYRLQYRIMEFCTSRHRLRHFAARKWLIRRQVHTLLNQADHPYKRVVVLGAGLDLLGIQVAHNYDVDVYEVDLKDTIHFKKALIGSMVHTDRITFLDADLSQDPANIDLFHTTLPTIWIVEGVFMFLPADAVLQLMNAIQRASSHPSRLIFTYVKKAYHGNPLAVNLQKFLLRMLKIPFQWQPTREAVEKMLAEMNVIKSEIITYQSLQRMAGNRTANELEGEAIVLCELR